VLGGRVPDQKLQPTNEYQGPSPSRESQYTCTVNTCIGCMPLRSKRSRHKSTYAAQSRNLRDDTLALVNCPHAMCVTPRQTYPVPFYVIDGNSPIYAIDYRLCYGYVLAPPALRIRRHRSIPNAPIYAIDYRLCYGYVLAPPALRIRRRRSIPNAPTSTTGFAMATPWLRLRYERDNWSIPIAHANRSTLKCDVGQYQPYTLVGRRRHDCF